MALWHLRSKKKPSGGTLKANKKKKRTQRGSEFLETKIGKRKPKSARTRGGSKKLKLLSVQNINVAEGKGKAKTVKVISVEENQANPHYVRRNIITKGAVVKTEIGSVRVTSRPGQHGTLNGVLIGKKA